MESTTTLAELEHSDVGKFIETAAEMVDYAKALGLPAEKYDRLISLIKQHVGAAQKDAFREGAQFGIRIRLAELTDADTDVWEDAEI